MVKNPPAEQELPGDVDLIPGSGGSPGRRVWQSTPVFLPGESCGQRSLAGYCPWGLKESADMTQVTEHAGLLN